MTLRSTLIEAVARVVRFQELYRGSNVCSARLDQEKPPQRLHVRGHGRNLRGGIDMAERTCSIDGCEKAARSRGWCHKHYTRWKRHGDPLTVYKGGAAPVPLLERLLSHIDASGDCWEWTASKSAQGYGTVGPEYPTRSAHRASWLLLVGPIAPGLQIDHLCRNPSCVNPDHLEPVTRSENLLRRKLRGRCKVCPLPHKAKGYCHKHYQSEYQRLGGPDGIV